MRGISRKSYLVWKVKPEIGIDCQHIFDRSMREIRRVKDKELFTNISDDDFMQKTVNCTWVLDYFNNKTFGRAQDPRANGAWLSKLTECNMKCLSYEDRELIRRARRDGREARRNEEREKRED